ncbi:hypothetical protein BRAS3843_3500009 [Bradyrhizobium sp. STM 3843]|nr:hypothetical protein BRAS3843_3500009 [Bradyrhizobium sp. STM 3843]
MDRADTGAGQHRIGGFRDHRQIDRDPVALADIAVAQDVGHLADFVVQLAIGNVPALRGIVALPDDRGLVAASGEMPVDAVVGGVQNAILEPFDGDVAGRERAILDLVRRLVPVDAPGLLGPEPVRIGDRAGVHLAVFRLIDEGAFRPLSRHVVDLLGHFILHTCGLQIGAAQAVVVPTMRPRNRARQAKTSRTFGGAVGHAPDQRIVRGGCGRVGADLRFAPLQPPRRLRLNSSRLPRMAAMNGKFEPFCLNFWTRYPCKNLLDRK